MFNFPARGVKLPRRGWIVSHQIKRVAWTSWELQLSMDGQYRPLVALASAMLIFGSQTLKALSRFMPACWVLK
jgi:hypothetical protein